MIALVPAIQKYLSSPSSGGLLEILEDVASGTLTIDPNLREQLEQVSSTPAVFSNQSIFEFDEKFWQLMARFSIPIDWLSVPLDTEVISETPTTDGDDIDWEKFEKWKSSFSSLMEVQKERDRDLDQYKSKSGNRLKFFASVNKWFGEKPSEAVQVYIDKSLELEQLLIDHAAPTLNPAFPSVSDPDLVSLDPMNWIWISLGVSNAYVAALDQLERTDEKPGNAEIWTAALMAWTHTSLLDVTCLMIQRNLLNKPLDILLQSRHFENKSKELNYRDPLFTEVAVLELENKNIVAAFLKILPMVCALTLANYSSLSYSRNKAWLVILKTWIDSRFDLDMKDFGTPFSLASCIYNAGEQPPLPKNTLVSQLAEGLDIDEIAELALDYDLGSVPDINLSVFLLKNRNYETGDREEQIAHELVATANRQLRRTGLALKLPLITEAESLNVGWLSEGSYDGGCFIKSRSVYYKSVSTMALNMREDEVRFEHFDAGNPTRCYISAARALINAGYSEHAVIFFAYSIFRASLVVSSDFGQVSVREIDRFIRKELDQFFSQKYLPLIFSAVLTLAEDLSFEYRLWISSYLSRYTKDIDDVDSGIMRPYVEDTRKLPEWFHQGTERLVDAFVSVRMALAAKNIDESDWRNTCRKYRVADCLGEILRQFEAQLLLLFEPIYIAHEEDADLRSALRQYSRWEVRSSEYNWYWVEQFLRALNQPSNRLEGWQPYVALRLLLESNLPGLGNLIIGMRERKAIIDSLQKCREIDNSYTSHNSPITSKGVVQIRAIPLIQVRLVMDFVTVDFGQIFMLMKKSSDDTG